MWHIFSLTVKISLTKVNTALKFFLRQAPFYLTNLSSIFRWARSRFRQFPDTCRPSPAIYAYMYAAPRARDKNTHVQWYIHFFSIASKVKRDWFYLALPPLRYVRSFRSCGFLSSRSVFRRANLRFEKLIARPSTCPCCVPPPVPLPDLLKRSRRSIVGTLRRSTHVRVPPLLRRWMRDAAGTGHSRDIRLCEDFPGWARQKVPFECKVPVNEIESLKMPFVS